MTFFFPTCHSNQKYWIRRACSIDPYAVNILVFFDTGSSSSIFDGIRDMLGWCFGMNWCSFDDFYTHFRSCGCVKGSNLKDRWMPTDKISSGSLIFSLCMTGFVYCLHVVNPAASSLFMFSILRPS